MTGMLRAVGTLLFGSKDTPEVETAQTAPPPSEDRHKCTVLAIDDDQNILEIMRTMLRADGFNVLTAQSGPKGLDLARYAQRDIRVVLLDYNMPRFNGSDTLQYLRRLAPRAKVVGLTGVAEELLPGAYREGVDRVFPKPFRAAELLALINELANTSATPTSATR